MPRLVLAALLLVAAAVAPTHSYGIGNRVVDADGRLPTLRFLHIPKTGTSFIMSMRNYLSACWVKDKVCSGDHGGTDRKYRFPEHTKIYIESCNDALEACSKVRYHSQFHVSHPWNYVTLLREPTAHAVSGYFYTNGVRRSKNQTQVSVQEYVSALGNLHVKVRVCACVCGARLASALVWMGKRFFGFSVCHVVKPPQFRFPTLHRSRC